MTTHQTLPRTHTGAHSAATPLRRFLALDAVVTAGNGLVYLLAAGPVGRLLDLPTGLLTGIGVFLTVYGLFVGYLATRPEPPVLPTRLVIEANLLWAAVSIGVLVLGPLTPNTVGTVWIPAQAALVAVFALLQLTALRTFRAARPASV